VPTLEIPPKFKKKLRKKDPQMAGRVMQCVLRLGEDPNHPGLNLHKIKGQDGIWEVRVDRKNRVTFAWDADTVVLLNHCNHDILSQPS
jgi:mRNA-degrading endonuclease RelE of RelBE toxin-antitoxin system